MGTLTGSAASKQASRARYTMGTKAKRSAAQMATAAARGHANLMSGERLVTAIIIFPRGSDTAEDCSDAFNAFSEQHQLAVTYEWSEGKDPPPSAVTGLQHATMGSVQYMMWSPH